MAGLAIEDDFRALQARVPCLAHGFCYTDSKYRGAMCTFQPYVQRQTGGGDAQCESLHE